MGPGVVCSTVCWGSGCRCGLCPSSGLWLPLQHSAWGSLCCVPVCNHSMPTNAHPSPSPRPSQCAHLHGRAAFHALAACRWLFIVLGRQSGRKGAGAGVPCIGAGTALLHLPPPPPATTSLQYLLPRVAQQEQEEQEELCKVGGKPSKGFCTFPRL